MRYNTLKWLWLLPRWMTHKRLNKGVYWSIQQRDWVSRLLSWRDEHILLHNEKRLKALHEIIEQQHRKYADYLKNRNARISEYGLIMQQPVEPVAGGRYVM